MKNANDEASTGIKRIERKRLKLKSKPVAKQAAKVGPDPRRCQPKFEI